MEKISNLLNQNAREEEQINLTNEEIKNANVEEMDEEQEEKYIEEDSIYKDAYNYLPIRNLISDGVNYSLKYSHYSKSQEEINETLISEKDFISCVRDAMSIFSCALFNGNYALCDIDYGTPKFVYENNKWVSVRCGKCEECETNFK
jgi:hypothetical protein